MSDPVRAEGRLRRDDEGERDAPHSDSRGDKEFSNEDWRVARQHTDPERRRKIREILSESLLPNLPRSPGVHRCWVSTASSQDTVDRRIRLGYTLCKPEILREEGFGGSDFSLKDADGKGYVRCREMIAMEIPTEDFIDIMRELHHDQPRELASGIYADLQELSLIAKERGAVIDLDEGFKEMSRHMRPPRQFES
jgi:hypothetical protein